MLIFVCCCLYPVWVGALLVSGPEIRTSAGIKAWEFQLAAAPFVGAGLLIALACGVGVAARVS